MKKNKDEIAGIIKSEKGNVIFSVENFKFTFMNANLTGDSIVLDVDEYGYIWGNTYTGKTIAIFARQNIEVIGTKVLYTWNYVISKNQILKDMMKNFKILRIRNGAIKSIFPCNALHERLDNKEDGTLVYEIKKDCKQYEININNKLILWRFSSIVNQKYSLYEGNSLTNSDSILDIVFSEEQNFSSLYSYLGYVHSLCAFLTFRDNIGYEKVSLMCDERYEFAECFIKYPEPVVARDFMKIIHVRRLEEKVFENIILNIMKEGDKNSGLPIFIIPKDDKDAMTIDVGKIRNICSALEMELDSGGVKLDVCSEMNNLICSVKDLIKDCRKNSSLSSKTFDYIFSNISHWGQPLSERAYSAWMQHYEEIRMLMRVYNIEIGEKEIQKFVKARNSMTHAGATDISNEVADTSFILMGLIYCCTLSRLGMSSVEIRDIMQRRFIG